MTTNSTGMELAVQRENAFQKYCKGGCHGCLIFFTAADYDKIPRFLPQEKEAALCRSVDYLKNPISNLAVAIEVIKIKNQNKETEGHRKYRRKMAIMQRCKEKSINISQTILKYKVNKAGI